MNLPLSIHLLIAPRKPKYRPVYMEYNAYCFGICKYLGHWLSMAFRGQKKWTVNMTLETIIKVKIVILCGMPPPLQSIDHIPVVFSIINCDSFFVFSFLSPLSKILNVTYPIVGYQSSTNCFKGHHLLNYLLDVNQNFRNDSYMTLINKS